VRSKYCQAYNNLKALLGTEDRDLIDLMLGLLEIDPEERLTAKEALFHPFFGQLMPFELSLGTGNGKIFIHWAVRC
jgi:serine/threonine protein kinase